MNEISDRAVLQQIWFTSNELFRQLELSLGAVHGIGFTEYMVLDALAQTPEKTIRRIDLAQKISRTASGVTRILAPLEKIGLIAKANNPRDARVSLVKLTDSGKRVWGEASQTVDTKVSAIFSTCTEEQKVGCKTCLRDIEVHLIQR